MQNVSHKVSLLLADACHSGWSGMWLLHARDSVRCDICRFAHLSGDCRKSQQDVENALQKCLVSDSCQVTGGSAGIGRAAALAFGQNGARVAIMGRRKERLDAVLTDLPRLVP